MKFGVKMDFAGNLFYSNAILMAHIKLFCACYVKAVGEALNVKCITNYFIAILSIA